MLTTYKFDNEIRKKYKSLTKNNIHNFNFAKHIQKIFSEINFNFNYYERNYQGKLNIYKFCLLLQKYMFFLIIKKIKIHIKIKNKIIIKIQSNIRRLIFIKKYKIFKKEIYNKYVLIQKYIRGFLLRKKYKDKLDYIINSINFNKMQKDYAEKVKIMIKKRDAIRVIEKWWENILEERKQKELEEKIKKMPKDCQDLYRQFVKMRKQTKIIKNEFNELTKDKYLFVP